MIIEIPNENSIVKWKNNDKDEWKVAEISDLIKAYEVDVETQLLGAELHGIKKGYEEAQKKLIRPQGNWVELPNYRHKCSICNVSADALANLTEQLSNYCPNCGAKMKRGAE